MEHFKDNSGCSGPKKSEIFWNNSRKVQYVFAGAALTVQKLLARLKFFFKTGQTPRSRSQVKIIMVPTERSYHREYSCEIS